MNMLKWIADRPHILLIIATLSWGGNAIAGKLAVGHISPMILTVSRWSIAIIIVWAFAWRHVIADWPIIKTRLPYLFAMGAVGYTCFNITLYSALQFTSAINVVIEQAAMPLVIFIGNLLIYRIATTRQQLLGFFLTLIGVLLVVSGGNPLAILNQGLNKGDALMVLAVILYAGYSIALKSKPAIHWKSFFAVLVTSAFLASIPAAFYEIATSKAIYPVTTQGILVALYAAIFPSIISQIAFIRAVEQLGANVAGLYFNLVPIFGTLLAIIIIGENFGWHHATSLVLVIGGIIYAQSGPRASVSALK